MPVMNGVGFTSFLKRTRSLKQKIVDSFDRAILSDTESERIKVLLDRSILFIGLMGPIMTIPQLMNVWMDHQVKGLAVVSWIAYTIIGFFWVVYGVVHKEKPIVFVNTGWILVNGATAVGILLFR